ncbi:MAG: hypothetical protein R3Y18_02105 [Bacillota bacterium]
MDKKMNDFKKLQSILKMQKDSHFDPNGSYTGVSKDGGEVSQDADDL